MPVAGLGGKIAHADFDSSAGTGGPHVGDEALSYLPREVALAVPRDPGGLGKVDYPIGFGGEGGFDFGRRPLESSGAALGAEGITQFLGFGADVGDGLVDGAAIRTQNATPPKESVLFGGVFLRVGIMRTHNRSRQVVPVQPVHPTTEARGEFGCYVAR